MKCGNLNILEPSGPLQACNGTDFIFNVVSSIAVRTSYIVRTYYLFHAQHLLSIRLPILEITKYTQIKVKVKQSHYRPGQAPRVPGDWGSQISWQSAHDGGKVGRPTNRPPLPQDIFLVLISARGWVDPRALHWGRKDFINEKLHWHHRESNLWHFSL